MVKKTSCKTIFQELYREEGHNVIPLRNLGEQDFIIL